MQEGASEIIGSYSKWHYGRAVKELVNISRNANRFLLHFFSFKLLLRTLFSPWRRLHENYKEGFDLSNFFSSLIVNVLMRLVGFFCRAAFLVIGTIILATTLLLSISIFVIWLFFPLLMLAVFASAIILILSAV
jgi:hypothetical protein